MVLPKIIDSALKELSTKIIIRKTFRLSEEISKQALKTVYTAKPDPITRSIIESLTPSKYTILKDRILDFIEKKLPENYLEYGKMKSREEIYKRFVVV